MAKTALYIFGAICIAAFFLPDNDEKEKSQWYEGGTLTYESSLAEWQTATPDDRLASAANIAWILLEQPDVNDPETETKVRVVSEAIVSCLNKLDTSAFPIGQTASACYLMTFEESQ